MSTTIKLIGSEPNQVSRNKDLGRLAYVDIATVPVPASASAEGNVGEIAIDADYIYVCIAKDTWKRVVVSTW